MLQTARNVVQYRIEDSYGHFAAPVSILDVLENERRICATYRKMYAKECHVLLQSDKEESDTKVLEMFLK